MFTVRLGTFLHDVQLKNITFSTGLLTVEESNARGFTVQEHIYPNGTKSFSLKVAFNAAVVLKTVCNKENCISYYACLLPLPNLTLPFKNPEPLVTIYSLPLIFGLIILPERTSFVHEVALQASLQDVGENSF